MQTKSAGSWSLTSYDALNNHEAPDAPDRDEGNICHEVIQALGFASERVMVVS